MPIAQNQLPDDIAALKSLVAEQLAINEKLQAEKQAIDQKNERLQARVLTLQEQLSLVLARRYAASSEKISPDQIPLFDEAEVEAEMAAEEEITVPAHKRSKRGRKKLPEALPRVEVVHELAEAERCCPHDGARLAEIGEVVSEQLDIVPAKIQVIRHIRKQYACDCGQCIRTAALPPQPIPKSLASEARYARRQKQARPILDEIRAWLDDVLPQVPPTSATGKALNYLHNEWDKLIHYLDDGRLEIDNNAAENAIRPFVTGRKNWLFSASVKGVKASANLYSLIETALCRIRHRAVYAEC